MHEIKNQMQFYDELWSNRFRLNSLQLRRAVAILSYLSKIMLKKKELKVLDLGCGDGRFSGFLGEFVDLDAIELSKKAVETARTNHPHVNFIHGSALDYSFKPESYDVVISQEVIEHIEDQQKYINICNEVLKPNGYLILTTPNKRVFDNMHIGNWSNQPIEKLLTPKTLRNVVSTHFNIQLYDSIIFNFGDKDYFKIVNHRYVIGVCNKLKINGIRNYILSKFGLGLHQCILAKKS